MMVNSLIAQIITAAIAIALVFFYIQPTLEIISTIQDRINVFETELVTVSSVNEQLNLHINAINNLSQQNRSALNRYFPEEVDVVEVLRNIYGLTIRTALIPTSLTAVPAQLNQSAAGVVTHDFNLTFSSTYDQLKSFLTLIERNDYPLEVSNMKITPTDGGFLMVTVDLVTYSNQ